MSATIERGTFAGMTREALVAFRGRLQEALIELAAGTKAVAVGYTAGAGGRQVTFAPADEDRIRGLIRQINAALDGRPRTAIGVVFR